MTAGWVLGYELGCALPAVPTPTGDSSRSRIRHSHGFATSRASPRCSACRANRREWRSCCRWTRNGTFGVANWVGADVSAPRLRRRKLVLAFDLIDRGALEAWLAGGPLARFTTATITEPAALRAELDRVRRRGWAELVDELEDGLAAVSVGVRAWRRDCSPRWSGSAVPTFRLGRTRPPRACCGVVQATASDLERALAR